MSLQPVVRTFTPDEWFTYRKLRLHSLSESPDAFGSSFEAESRLLDAFWIDRLKQKSDGTVNHPVVAEVDGVAAGLAWGRVTPEDKDVAHVYQMWVAPEFRGRGIGRLLLREIIQWAKLQNVLHLSLRVATTHYYAERLYLQVGFHFVNGTDESRTGTGLAEREMRLDL